MHDLIHPRQATPPREPDGAGVTATLTADHRLILRALAVADAIAARATAGQPLDRATLGWLVDFLRTFADRCHHAKEENHLFPALARRGVPVDGGPIGVMLAEHDVGRRLIQAMGEADDARAAAALRDYATLLRAHIDKEDHVLFPLAEQVLDAREQDALARSFLAVEEDLLAGRHDRLEAELAGVEARLKAA